MDKLSEWSPEKIIERLKNAAKMALSEKEYKATVEEQNQIIDSFLIGALPVDEYNQRIKEHNLQAGVAEFETYREFKFALEFILPPGDPEHERKVREYLEHENAHLAKALEHGLRGKYTIEFKWHDSGELYFIPSVSFAIPANFPKEKIQALTHDVISAPDELSPGDKAQLGMKD